MTDEQREQIIHMRREGIGYRNIGKELSLSRDVVRNYCKSINMGGYGIDIKGDDNDNHCLMCNKEFVKNDTGRKRKFCSEECRRAYWKKHPELMQKKTHTYTCPNCNEEFTTVTRGQKFCSHDCYIRFRFKESITVQELAEMLRKNKKIPRLPKWMAVLLYDAVVEAMYRK